jgi:hypothetical protein
MRDYAIFFGAALCVLLAMAFDLTAELASLFGRNWLAVGSGCRNVADYLIERAMQVYQEDF